VTDYVVLSAEEADALLASTILTDEGRQDPYPAYARLRAGGGRWTSGFGATGLAGYDDCLAALRNPALGRPEPDMDLPDGLGGRERRQTDNEVTMLFLNPPDHTRIRGLVSRAFTPRRVEELRPQIDALLSPVVDRLADAGGGDIVSELAIPFPVAVISELLGVPRDGNEHIQPWVRAITAFIDPAATDEALAEGERAGLELVAFFSDLIEDLAAQFGMLHLATTEHDRDLHLVALTEKLGDLLGLGSEVSGADLGPVLHLLDHHVGALLARFLGSLCGLVLVLAVIHDPADGRIGLISHLHEVEFEFPGHVKSLGQGRDSDLGAIGSDQPHLAGADAIVDPWLVIHGRCYGQSLLIRASSSLGCSGGLGS
jgi:hypothetical protein